MGVGGREASATRKEVPALSLNQETKGRAMPSQRATFLPENGSNQPRDVIITSQLRERPFRTPHHGAEAAAMQRLSDTMAIEPSQIFHVCVEAALELCQADTCGISVRERTDAGKDIFRWIALTGVLKHHLHGTTPRYFSPCGVCVDSGAPLLMRQPELVYKYLDVGPPFQDVLLIPLVEKTRQIEATIWIVAHNGTRKFDSEDARVMQNIGAFVERALTWRTTERS